MSSMWVQTVFRCTLLLVLVNAKADMDDVEIMITEERYAVEKHYVTTDDNYTLGLHRIPPKQPTGAKVVLLMHGLFSSAADYLVFGRSNSLGYILSTAGYDVWLGNCRGTTFSRKHSHLNADVDSEFWNYSFHEMGIYDLPAIIDYVLTTTTQPWLDYVGHSQGCGIFFVMTSELPGYSVKVRTMHAMAPAVFLPPTTTVYGTVLNLVDSFESMSHRFNFYEISMDNSDLQYLLSRAPLCAKKSILQKFCVDTIFGALGIVTPPISKRMARHMVNNAPNTISTKQLVHFGQLIKTERFQKFDYKTAANLRFYGQAEPPEYDLCKVNVKLYVYYGSKDYTTPVKGVKHLINTCGSKVMHAQKVLGFDHIDFLFAQTVKQKVYDQIMLNLKS